MDDYSLRAPFFLLDDLVPRHGGKPALALACVGWLLYLAALVFMFIASR